MPERPNMWHIFEKRIVQGYQKWYSHVPNAQLQKYKYKIHKDTNTQKQHKTKCQKDRTCGIFFKRALFKDIKNYIPMCRTHKYKNTNTKIYKYSIWRSARKTQHVAYFWKEDCSRVSKIIFPYNTNLNIWVSHSCTWSSSQTCPANLIRNDRFTTAEENGNDQKLISSQRQ